MAAQLGADVTVVEADGLGGAAVLTDVVPSKTLIATAEAMDLLASSPALGLRAAGNGALPANAVDVDLAAVNRRVRALARAQSLDVRGRLEAEGVRLVEGCGRLDGAGAVAVDGAGGRAPVRRRHRAGRDRRSAAGAAGRAAGR